MIQKEQGIVYKYFNGYDNMLFDVLLLLNALRPHDALKHHFTSLKTDLIFLIQRVLKPKFS